LRETAKGVTDQLEQSGTLNKYSISVDTKNAQNEFYIAQSVAQDIVNQKYDYIISLTTPALQAVANLNKKIPHIFGAVTDPYRAGVAKTREDHLPNITGIATVEPVEPTIKFMRELFPDAKRIGIIWNPGEACSETCTSLARQAAKKYNFELLEATVTTTNEIMDALKSLLSKNIDLFLTSGDNTVIMSLESIAGMLKEHKIPYFTNASSDVAHGAFVSVGPDYYVIGKEVARLAERVIQGEQPHNMPIEDFAPDIISINLDLAKAYNLTIPPGSLQKADKIFSGGKLTTLSEKKPAHPVTAAPKKLALFLYSDTTILLEAAKGVTDELKQSGILDQHNVTIDTKNSQNELYLAQSIAQDIVRQKYDYIITISTLALQVMANANKQIPHIFGAVTDPYRMGVAKNTTDHLTNVTGVATFQPVETTFRVMREIFPQAKKIGIIWNPAEACSEACTYKARDAAKKYNFVLQEINVNSTSEVLDALNSLLNKKIDLFLTSGDNTVIMALESIAAILKKHRIPYFTNTPSDVDHGAFFSIGADYTEVGKETARMAERVINGENPATIPINNYVPEKIAVNASLAKEYGITIPETVLKKASYVKR
jgi:putative ABC transport system permease protein